MSEFEVRGYMMSTTAAYLRETAASRRLSDPSKHFSSALSASLSNVVPVGWYPVAHVAELNRHIVTLLAGDEEQRAREELHSCGRFMAVEATNTFMRLLMRVLTPTLFAKKLPDLWRRDCKHGELAIEVDDRRMVLGLNGMNGHDHIAAVMPGYVGFALEKMGKVVDDVKIDGWSLTNPGATNSKIHFTWKS